MCYNYSKLEGVIIICSYDWWISNKSTHQSRPRLQVTKARDNIKSSFFINIKPCIPFKANRRFGGTCRLHFQNRRMSQARNELEVGSKKTYIYVSNCRTEFYPLEFCRKRDFNTKISGKICDISIRLMVNFCSPIALPQGQAPWNTNEVKNSACVEFDFKSAIGCFPDLTIPVYFANFNTSSKKMQGKALPVTGRGGL
jgi:hypothetical protein